MVTCLNGQPNHECNGASMARSHVAIALAAACFALLVVFQLVSTFGFPHISFLNLYHTSSNTRTVPPFQIPIDGDFSENYAAKDGSLYLLGVGKADITG